MTYWEIQISFALAHPWNHMSMTKSKVGFDESDEDDQRERKKKNNVLII